MRPWRAGEWSQVMAQWRAESGNGCGGRSESGDGGGCQSGEVHGGGGRARNEELESHFCFNLAVVMPMMANNIMML